MPQVPNYTHFKLSAPLGHAPAGATGQLTRLDSHYVALDFDGAYPGLAYDVNDTEPEVWQAIKPHSALNPSMVDPPYKAVLYSLATLLITTPIAVLFVHTTGRGEINTFAIGILWAALRFGSRGAVPLFFASLLVDQVFIPGGTLALIPVTLIQGYALGFLALLAFIRDIDRRFLHSD